MKAVYSTIASLILIAALPSHAATLANYQFVSGTAASSDSSEHSTATDFAIGPAGTNWAISAATSTALAYGNTTSSSESNALSAGSYFEFSITPDTGYTLNLVSLSFDTIANAVTTLSGDASVTFSVYSSVNNYETAISSFSQDYINNNSFVATSRSVDLSLIDWQGLNDQVTFRFYIWDNSNSAQRTARLANVSLIGETYAIPETSTVTLSLAMVALFSAIAIRRKKKA